MNIQYLFTGSPKEYQWENKEFSTSIFRDRVQQLEVKDRKLLGNVQADKKHHGGPFKEVYSYAVEDYRFW